MRETDPTRPAPEPALEPDALAEPAAPSVPGIPVDDDEDDILADTFVEDELPPLPVEALQPQDEFDDMNLDEPELRPIAAGDNVELEVDVDLDEPEPARVLGLVNSESSLSMELPVPEPDAPKGPSKRTTAAQLRHDLRTPFNQIIGYSEMLIEDAEASSNDFV